MGRPRWIAVVLAALIASTSGTLVHLRGPATPVDVDEVVERFRGGAAAAGGTTSPDVRATATPSAGSDRGSARPAAAGPQAGPGGTPAPAGPSDGGPGEVGGRPMPDEGVYVYATSGGEEVDVLGGSRHDYPEETTIIVRHDGCGLVERWDAMEERWSERETCPSPDGLLLARTTSYHEFFRQGDERTLRCDPGTFARPDTEEPGTTWTGACRSENTTAEITGRIVGAEMLEVAGRPVRTLHVRVDVRVSGSQSGESHNDTWGDFETGLVVRERSTTDTRGREPVVGEVRYREAYELNLTSLQPRR